MTSPRRPGTTPPELHALLGLEEGADDEEVLAAFRRLALSAHPDHDPSPGANARMRALIAARDGLMAGMAEREPVDFEVFLERVVAPAFGHPNREAGRAVARLINRDPTAPIRVRGLAR